MKAYLSSNKIVAFGIVLAFTLGAEILYLVNEFKFVNDKITHIELVSEDSEKLTSSFIYLADSSEININYHKEYKEKILTDSSCIISIADHKRMRWFRIYSLKSIQNIPLTKVYLVDNQGNRLERVLDDFSFSDGASLIDNKISFKTSSSYMEYDFAMIYPTEVKKVILSFFVIIAFSIAFSVVLGNVEIGNLFKNYTYKDWTFALFILCIFLPKPFNNIFLIASLILFINQFNLKKHLANKANLISLMVFLIFLLNDLFISESGWNNLRATETNLPWLVIPILITSIPKKNYLIFLPVAGLALGAVFFSTSVLDFMLIGDLKCFVFSNLTKYLHPVYFSYLLSFSIFYLLFNDDKLEPKVRKVVISCLGILLVLAASKLVLLFSIAVFVFYKMKNVKLVAVTLLSLVLLIMFSPIKERFAEIVDVEALSILKENKIDSYDTRVNGLTFRLILSQESLKQIENLKDFIFGVGVDDKVKDDFRLRLKKRGLTGHLKYHVHNQYINTFVRSGFVGISILLAWLIYSLYIGYKLKSKLLIYIVTLLMLSMITEPVFQRNLGIVFFVTIISILIKNILTNEDRYIRD